MIGAEDDQGVVRFRTEGVEYAADVEIDEGNAGVIRGAHGAQEEPVRSGVLVFVAVLDPVPECKQLFGVLRHKGMRHVGAAVELVPGERTFKGRMRFDEAAPKKERLFRIAAFQEIYRSVGHPVGFMKVRGQLGRLRNVIIFAPDAMGFEDVTISVLVQEFVKVIAIRFRLFGDVTRFKPPHL